MTRGVVATVFVTVIGAVYQLGGAGQGKSGAPASTSSSGNQGGTEAVSPPHNSLCQAIQDFLGPDSHEPGAPVAEKSTLSVNAAKQTGGGSNATCTLPSAPPLGSLIATLPDPVNTHLSLSFDRSIEALMRAMQDSGYEYASNYFPWEPPVDRDEADPDKAEQRRTRKKERAGEAGVLFFRRNPLRKVEGPSGPCAPLYADKMGIFLVLETPTAGVNRTAFHTGMSYVAQQQAHAPLDKCTVPLIGPTFSGSIRSLGDAIANENRRWNKAFTFNVISGTASSPERFDRAKAAGMADQFHAVVHDEGTATDFLLQHFYSEWKKEFRPIAFLSEAGTAYGADVAQYTHQPLSGNTVDIIKMKFPRDISRLRNAYQETLEQNARAAGEKPPAPRTALPLDLRDFSRGSDSAPIFSNAQTPVSQDAVLTSIATTLRRERVKVAGISATDPMDAIFLIRFLRSASPDVRLFLVGADLLFVQAAADSPLDGMLNVTTYPLILRNQDWTGWRGARVQFPSLDAQGTYNAARAALLTALGRNNPEKFSEDDELLEYFPPQEQNSNADASKPPLWITVLSRSGFWPLAVGPSIKARTVVLPWPNIHKRTDTFVPEGLPRVWLASILIDAAASLGFVLCMLLAMSILEQRDWTMNFLPTPREPRGRAVYLAITILSLLTVYVTFAAPLWSLWAQARLRAPGFLGSIARWASIIPALVLLAALIYVVATLLSRTSGGEWSGHAYLGMFALISVGITGVGLWSVFTKDTGHQERFFFAYRALDLVSGVSPITPLLFLEFAICCWAWIHARRLLLFHTRNPPLPAIDRTGAIRLLRIEVDNAISQPYLQWPWRVMMIAAGIVFVSVLLRGYLLSVEPVFYDRLYSFLLALVVFLIMLTGSRFLLIWLHMRNLLEVLEEHPLRQAFSGMPARPAWSPILQRAIMRRTTSLESRSLQIARYIQTLQAANGATDVNWSTADFANFEDEIAGALETIGLRRRLDEPQCYRMAATLDRMAKAPVNFLSTHVWFRGDSESLAEARRKEPAQVHTWKDDIALLANEFVALPYLAFIESTFLQMRNLLTFIVMGFVFALISVNSYPFQSHHVIGWAMTILFLIIGCGITIIFIQMDRDALLSRLADTKAGHVDKGALLLRLSAVGALPLITVLATQFPAIGRILFSWVRPTLEALR